MKKDWSAPRTRADVEAQIFDGYLEKDDETQQRRNLALLLQECAFAEHIPIYCAIDAEHISAEDRKAMQLAADGVGGNFQVRGGIILGENIREMFLFAEQGIPETHGIRYTTAAELVTENYMLHFREVLETQGYHTALIMPDVLPDPELSTLMASSGKGAAGRNGRFIAGAYGAKVCCGLVLTDAPLMGGDYRFPDYPPDVCGDCRLCADACPAGALSMDGSFDRDLCLAYRNDPENQEEVDEYTVRKCMRCMEVCPAR